MATTPATPSNQPTSIEGKVLLASKEAAIAVDLFSPQVAQAVNLGVAVEPLFKTLGQMLINIFHHHTGVPHPATAAAGK